MQNAPRFIISQRAVENASLTRKRESAMEEWKDRAAKINKDAGQEYVSRDGILKPALDKPAGRKVCKAKCTKPGCSISSQRKLDLFEQFRSVPADVQSALLIVCFERVESPGVNESYRYYLMDEHGYKKESCMKTIMDVFGITEGRLRILKDKIKTGIFAPIDGRGQHTNRPHKIPQLFHTEVEDHIMSHPHEISHYSRAKGNPDRKYLGANENASKMIRSFQGAVEHTEFSNHWFYRKTLRDMDFHFATPKSDTCCVCDKNKVALQNASPAEKESLELESLFHLVQWESAYEALRMDIERNVNSVHHVTIALDLEQVLFSPVLSNSEYFYQRKYSSYNFGITFPSRHKTIFSFWTESIAKRGADEIASGILKTIQRNYTPLLPGNPKRTLNVWNDCCGGQNKNWIMICMYYYLVHAGYFNEITQNFLVTGHTFLPTDRDFGVIEKAKKGVNINVPSDWVSLIRNCRPDNPFEVQEMTQDSIYFVRQLQSIIVKPKSVRFADVAAFRIVDTSPYRIYTKISHEPGSEWEEHNLCLRIPLNQIKTITFIRKYSSPIPISEEKRKDLKNMCDYLLPEYRNFYLSL